MNLSLLNELFVEEARNLRAAQEAFGDVLPRMEQAAVEEELRHHLAARGQAAQREIKLIDELLARLQVPSRGGHSAGMEGILAEVSEILCHGTGVYPEPIDPKLVIVAGEAGGYTIAALRSLSLTARQMQSDHAERLLEDAIAREVELDRALAESADEVLRWSCT